MCNIMVLPEFDLAIVTLIYKILSGLYLGKSEVYELILTRDIG